MPTTLITGAGRGIGLELARQYLDAGWTVHAGCRRPEGAQDLRTMAASSEGGLTVHELDVTDAAQIRALATRLSGESIDILVNNAGLYGPRDASFGNVDDAAWIETIRVNAIAPLHLAEALIDQVARSERRIIANMTSKMGSVGDNTSGGHYIYRSSKAALNIVTSSLAVDLAGRGVTAIVLHPGWVRTDMGGGGAPLTAEDSVTGIRRVLDSVGPEDSGRFFGHDGVEVPW